jgi:hypothetical protein
MSDDAKVDALVSHIRATVGDSPKEWPGGWTNDIEAALIDAVFSTRARYGNRTQGKETGVFGAVTRYRESRGGQADDLTVLAGTDVDDLAEITNSGKVSRRRKAEVVVEAAGALAAAGVIHAADFAPNLGAAENAYRGVKGCGPVTWRYLRMLLGEPDVKPDVWILRFLDEAGVKDSDKDAAVQLLTDASKQLGLEVRQLDHAIWSYQRSA